MRIIRYIAVHCTASSVNTTPNDLLRYWHHEKGWKSPGYHYLVLRDGEVVQLLEEERISNGVRGYNKVTLNVAYIGGIDRAGKPVDNRTPRQEAALFDLLVELSERFPEAEILGHRDFPGVAKACPCFDVKAWLQRYTPQDLRNAA